MSFWRLLNTTGTVHRRTAIVLDATTLAAMAASQRAPTEPYRVEVEVDHDGLAGARGSVLVTGTSGGVGASQSLDFSSVLPAGGKARLSTTRRWDAGTTFSVTGSGWASTAATVTGYAIDGDGTQRKMLVAHATGIPMRIDRRGPVGTLAVPREGSWEDNEATLFLPVGSGWTPRPDDEVTDDSTGIGWRVRSTPTLDDASNQHHYEIPVIRNHG